MLSAIVPPKSVSLRIMRRAILVTLTFVFASSAFAAGKRWDLQTSAITIPFDRFVFSTRLPEGWSVDGGVVLPPVEMRHACQVRGDIYGGRDWERMLEAALEPENAARSGEGRSLYKVGGHVAVKNTYVDRSGKRIENVYVNLADLEPGTVSVWRFEGDDSAEGRQCEMGFALFTGSASIVLRPDADAPPAPGGAM